MEAGPFCKMTPPPAPIALAESFAALLAWYRANKREMPWRGHPDPYAVWVSEIMLQQTQVETVRPYFARFLAAFPTIAALAAAEDDPLLKAWEGLGYYTRVRNLRKAARLLVAENAGCLPTTSAELAKLPGIGPYTAAAIASICFGEAVPVVDGNVIRVFARHNALPDDFSAQPPRRALAAWLTPFIQASGSPSDFNQAMMELGALLCSPHRPDCAACPLRATCRAAAEGTQLDFPRPSPKKPLPTRRQKVLLLRNTAGALLLARHPGERLLAGFWELPQLDALPFPLPAKPRRHSTYRQTFTHFHLHQTIYAAPPVPPVSLPDTFTWAPDPSALPLTTATRKILAADR